MVLDEPYAYIICSTCPQLQSYSLFELLIMDSEELYQFCGVSVLRPDLTRRVVTTISILPDWHLALISLSSGLSSLEEQNNPL